MKEKLFLLVKWEFKPPALDEEVIHFLSVYFHMSSTHYNFILVLLAKKSNPPKNR